MAEVGEFDLGPHLVDLIWRRFTIPLLMAWIVIAARVILSLLISAALYRSTSSEEPGSKGCGLQLSLLIEWHA